MMYSQLSEIDRKMIRLLLESEGTIPSRELSLKLGGPPEHCSAKKEES